MDFATLELIVNNVNDNAPQIKTIILESAKRQDQNGKKLFENTLTNPTLLPILVGFRLYFKKSSNFENQKGLYDMVHMMVHMVWSI